MCKAEGNNLWTAVFSDLLFLPAPSLCLCSVGTCIVLPAANWAAHAHARHVCSAGMEVVYLGCPLPACKPVTFAAPEQIWKGEGCK